MLMVILVIFNSVLFTQIENNFKRTLAKEDLTVSVKIDSYYELEIL